MKSSDLIGRLFFTMLPTICKIYNAYQTPQAKVHFDCIKLMICPPTGAQCSDFSKLLCYFNITDRIPLEFIEQDYKY